MKCPYCNHNLDIKLLKGDSVVAGQSPSAPASEDLGELLDSINEDELDAKAAEFVRKTRERYEQYGSRTRMTEPQMKWLKDIAGGSNRKDSW